MREILFRAKSEDNYPYPSRWEYGIPYEDSYGSYVMKTSYGLVDVKKDTVGEFTGLTDKNGVKIFEGDIINETVDPIHKDRVFVVAWSDEYVSFIANSFNAKDRTFNWLRSRLDMLSSDIVVIGNVHDNPELVGGDDHAAD